MRKIAFVGAMMASLAGVCATNVTERVVLAADADWRGLGPVTMADGASIDLAGHTL